MLYELKKTDRLALHKVVTSLAKTPMKNAEAETLLIRYAASALMTRDRDPGIEKPLMAYIDSCLKNRHKAETVTRRTVPLASRCVLCPSYIPRTP